MTQTIDINALAAAKILKKDPPRAEARVKIRVNCRTEGHVLCGEMLRAGDQTIEVYEGDVRAFVDAVETADLSGAKARLARYEAAIASKRAGKPVADTAIPRFPLSLEAVFRELEGRDIQPLVSVERVEERRPAKG
jgi:hypothetical protein